MINIAVVDDDDEEREFISECLDYITQKKGTEFSVYQFKNGEDFLGAKTVGYDIVLMDIELPGMDGIEVSKRLRQIDKTVILMFVTHMSQFAVKGYEVDALDFLIKPIDKYSFALKMARAIARSAVRFDGSYLIKIDGETISIKQNTIKYIEADGHYVVYHTIDGVYKEYALLKSVEKKLGDNFVRCNSCFLVNLKYVDGVRKNAVIIGDDELLISRPKKAPFLAAFSAFISGGELR